MSNNSNDNQPESSMMDKENEEKRSSPEEVFAEIIKSSNEYTTESPEILLSKKSKLLSVLKTHRPIKADNYQFGLSENLRENRRLIVFEWDDEVRVREYSKKQNNWRCTGCHTHTHHEPLLPGYLYYINNIVFVPIKHDCPPRDYNIVMQYQKYLEEGDTTAAKRMSQKVSFEYGKSSLSNIINVINSLSTTKSSTKNGRVNANKDVAKTSASLKRKLNGDNKDDLMSSAVKKPKLESHEIKSEMIKEENNQKVNNQLFVNDEPGTSSNQELEDTVANNVEKTISSNLFQVPSTSVFKKICTKLGIEYCKEVEEFWKEIHIKEVNFSSTNIKTQKFKTKNFYKILSNFFTGKFCDYGQIYYAINEALCEKLVNKGNMSFDEIDSLCSSYTVTDQHFKFIAKYIPCRILIFDRDENGIRKFGKWKNSSSSNNILTLILSFSKRKYSIVVDL